MVCSGTRCKQIVTRILERREQEAAVHGLESLSRPKFVWEPIPDLCLPSELDSFWEAAKLVDIVSPNEEELAGYFGCRYMTDRKAKSKFTIVEEVMNHGIGPGANGSLIVRMGKRGCTIFTPARSMHMRPYFLPADDGTTNENVVDPTGGGNTFLGALCKAIAVESSSKIENIIAAITSRRNEFKPTSTGKEGRIAAASVLATVAASFAIEQPGVPTLSHGQSNELWNGEPFDDRMAAYIRRDKGRIAEQNFF